MFKELSSMVDELQSTPHKNKKLEILANYADLQVFLKYTYHPYYQYHVTSKHLNKFAKTYEASKDNVTLPINEDGFFELLNELKSRKITGTAALQKVLDFLEGVQSEYGEKVRDILLQVIDKGLSKCRISGKSVNKVFPGLIPSFDVALAQKYKDFSDKIYLSVDTWYCSRKLDGLRLLAIFSDDGEVTLMSRTGKEYVTLNGLVQELKTLKLSNMILDGELVWLDSEGNDNFSEIHQRIRRKDFQIDIENIRYEVFDILTTTEFDERFSEIKLSDRWKRSSRVGINDLPHVNILPQEIIDDKNVLEKYLREVSEDFGWEGLIIRKDTVYQGKRTSDILKCKLFLEDEFVVHDVYNSEQELYYQGQLQTRTALAGIIVKFQDNYVHVGSKWTVDERVYYYEHPEELIGKTVTVSYKSVVKNVRTGKSSLQFPTIKAIHGDTRQY
jgi:DNA ligase-1